MVQLLMFDASIIMDIIQGKLSVCTAVLEQNISLLGFKMERK